MARKAVSDNEKKEAIISAAMDCFFEKGYDGTSIRTIMKRAGAEVGLFYYYFNSKDEVFDKVLDKFFSGYQKDFSEIADRVYRDPFRTLTRFFLYMIKETERFREKYAEKMHRTVRWAIREHTLTIIVPYIRQIIDVLTSFGAKPPLNLDLTAIVLAHGVGSTILHENSDWIKQNLHDSRKAGNLLMGLNSETSDLMFPENPNAEEIPLIADMAQGMKENFPGVVRSEFELLLKEKIEKGEAIVIRNQDKIAGCILFSRNEKEIEFLAVSPDLRKQGVASRLLITAMSEFPPETELSVVTYRDGDAIGNDARRFYKKFGFKDGEYLTVFDYPCQRLIGHAPKNVTEITHC